MIHPPALRVRPTYSGLLYVVQTTTFDADLVGADRRVVPCWWYVSLKTLWISPCCWVRSLIMPTGSCCEGENATWVPRMLTLVHNVAVAVALGASFAAFTNSIGLDVSCVRVGGSGTILRDDDAEHAGSFAVTEAPKELAGPLTLSSLLLFGAQVLLTSAFSLHFQQVISFFVQTAAESRKTAMHCACCCPSRQLRSDTCFLCLSRLAGDRLVVAAEAGALAYVTLRALTEVDAVVELVLASVVFSLVAQILQSAAVWALFASQSTLIQFATPDDDVFYERYSLDYCGYPSGTFCSPLRALSALVYAALHTLCCCWFCDHCCSSDCPRPELCIPIDYDALVRPSNNDAAPAPDAAFSLLGSDLDEEDRPPSRASRLSRSSPLPLPARRSTRSIQQQ